MIDGILAGSPLTQSSSLSRPGAAAPAQTTANEILATERVTQSANGARDAGVGASDAASDQAVEQPPSSSSPGPENDFGQRGTLVDIAA
jgi:hypothetical protein